MSQPERGFLAHVTQPVELPRGKTLIASGEELAAVILPESGLVSILVDLPDGGTAEVATLGRDGVVGLGALLGDARSSIRAVVRVAGVGQRIGVAELRSVADRSPVLRDLVRRLAGAMLAQAGTAAACLAGHALDRRAARWLLAAADLVGPGFPLTQEELAASLGARRPSVNAALGALRSAGLIRQARGLIAIADRPGLEARSCSCHASLRLQLDRLLRSGAAAAEARPVSARLSGF
jgi:CRP-like cAMP-binding protein